MAPAVDGAGAAQASRPLPATMLKRKGGDALGFNEQGAKAGSSADLKGKRRQIDSESVMIAHPNRSAPVDLSTIAPSQRRLIIALDMDAFYVAASRLRDPSLHGRPIGIKQKSLLATVSYEGRARGVRKLASLREALTKCPDLLLVDGEDLSWFRRVSKVCGDIAKQVVWGGKVEKLGMDELFCDVTEMVDAHLEQRLADGTAPTAELAFFGLRPGAAAHALQLPSDPDVDPYIGFWFDPSAMPGHILPERRESDGENGDDGSHDRQMPGGVAIPTGQTLYALRLQLASHLAQHLRGLIEREVGLTLSAGVAHHKMAAKLIGSKHKPNDQTLWLPSVRTPNGAIDPDADAAQRDAALCTFLDPLEARAINGFGSAIVQTCRDAIAGRGPVRALAIDPSSAGPAPPSTTATGGRLAPREREAQLADDHPLLVGLLRSYFDAPGFDALFGARLGPRLWGLLQGKDDEPVAPAPDFPAQIGIEDTYPRGGLAGEAQIATEVHKLARSLLRRLEFELLAEAGQHSGIPGSAEAGGPSESIKAALRSIKAQRFDYKNETIHQQGIDGIVRTYTALEDERAGAFSSKARWMRYPTGLRFSIRQGLKSRTTRQSKMPVGIFQRAAAGSEARAQQITDACMKLYRQIVASGGLETDLEVGSINLLNITAFDLSTVRPGRSIGAMFSASGATPKMAPSVIAEQAGTHMQQIDLDVFEQLPPDVQQELLRSGSLDPSQHAELEKRRAAAVDNGEARVEVTSNLETAPTTSSEMICTVCKEKMLVFLQHDHERWPARGLEEAHAEDDTGQIEDLDWSSDV